MHLIVNADDLGYSPGVNEAILDLHQAGRLSSASVVVNLPHSAAGISAARSAGLPVGVHLNLTRGEPCLPAARIPSLVTAGGAFHSSPVFFVRAFAGLIRRADVEAECRAQIDHALAGLGRVTHLDSHSHWHLVPALGAILRRLAHDYGNRPVRVAAPRRTLVPNALWLATVPADLAPAERRAECPARSDYLFSLHHWLEGAGPVPQFTGPRLRRLFDPPDVTVELVTHPGRAADPEFPEDTLPASQRQREVDFLLGPAFSGWLAAVGGEVSRPLHQSTE